MEGEEGDRHPSELLLRLMLRLVLLLLLLLEALVIAFPLRSLNPVSTAVTVITIIIREG